MKKRVSIIGGGAAALALACFLDGKKYNISLFEKNKALGRKFLVAGKGGFNLTHAEAINQLIERYTPSDFLDDALNSFSNDDFRVWLASIGVPTFIGSSNRIYPEKEFKPIEVLKAIEKVMTHNGVQVNFEKTWSGWNEEQNLLFADKTSVETDITIFALGGGSWKVTGSDGSWLKLLGSTKIETISFKPSNCAFKVELPETIFSRYKGKPLKNIEITCDGKSQKGEVVLSENGLEGNAIYALSPQLREGLQQGKVIIAIDFKPHQTTEDVFQKLNQSILKNTTDKLKVDLKLSALQVALIKEHTTKEEFLDQHFLAKKIKKFELNILDIATIDEAISTVGGIDLKEVNGNFELIQLPNTFCIGEMLDWDAPTGGYLLQACFSMGYYLAEHMNNQK